MSGAIHSIIGPNGAGKTTVFNCIMQNLPISGGKIWFRGERMDGLTPDRVAAAGVSRTYQNIRLFRNVTAMENLLVGMHLHLRSHWWGALLNSPHTRRSEQEAHEEALEAPALRRACAAAATFSPAISPTASSGGLKSDGRSRRGRNCSCSMSRRRG